MHRNRRIKFVLGLSIMGLAGLGYVLLHRSVPRASGPLAHGAYVWQRSWDDAVRVAVDQSRTDLAELVVLAAEVSWEEDEPRVVRVQLDHGTLAASGLPVGIALRVGPYSGPFEADNAGATAFLADLAASLVSEARAGGLTVVELQIDFDCATTNLDGYCLWVKAIRRRVLPVPIAVTALPTWLRSPAFGRLARSCDGFVLQVHSLDRPASWEEPMVLCDPVKAREAVERAGRLGRPFRVALPTYGYLVAFDEEGDFIGLSAEGPQVAWPSGIRIREVRADPEAMAGLVQVWTADRPIHLKALVWYRLPTDDDVLNWRWPTLAAVMTGTIPRPAIHARVRRPMPDLVEIDLVNEGQADASPQVRVSVHFPGAELVAGDALEGFELRNIGPADVIFASQGGSAADWIGPGEARMIGWLRLDTDMEVHVDVETIQP